VLGARRFKLPASTPERVRIQTGDVGHQVVTTIPETVGFDGGIPPPWLFIHAGPPHVHLLMEEWSRMLAFRLAMWTWAPMDFCPRQSTLQWRSSA
jgi:hypothetical protein